MRKTTFLRDALPPHGSISSESTIPPLDTPDIGCFHLEADKRRVSAESKEGEDDGIGGEGSLAAQFLGANPAENKQEDYSTFFSPERIDSSPPTAKSTHSLPRPSVRPLEGVATQETQALAAKPLPAPAVPPSPAPLPNLPVRQTETDALADLAFRLSSIKSTLSHLFAVGAFEDLLSDEPIFAQDVFNKVLEPISDTLADIKSTIRQDLLLPVEQLRNGLAKLEAEVAISTHRTNEQEHRRSQVVEKTTVQQMEMTAMQAALEKMKQEQEVKEKRRVAGLPTMSPQPTSIPAPHPYPV
ncbi:hypothetical protein JCM11641_007327 [Rhodosporidiobolus odoratus]